MRFLLAFAVLLLAPLCLRAADPAEQPPRPNVLLIFSDDQGMHDLACYGGEFPTPNLDALAAAGTRFTQWYVASSICTPSRYGLLTGRYPSRSRDGLLGALMFLGEEDEARGIRPEETTIAERLREARYRTALIGKWHLGHGEAAFLPTRHGFERFFGHTGGCVDFFTLRYGSREDWCHQERHVRPAGYATEVITNAAVEFLGAQTAEQPFFLFLAYNAPHFAKGWDAEAGKTENIMQPRPEDLERVKGIEDPLRRAFAAKVVGMDDGIGRVLAALEERELARNTLVIFMTDNGGDPVYGGSNEPFRGVKATLYEGGIRVPCLMRWPGRIPVGRTCEAVAGAIDLFPTLARLAGLEVEASELDGRNITPLLLGGPGEEREMLWQLGAHAELGRSNWSALRAGDWKLVAAPDAAPELFNIAKDPSEKYDLAAEEPERLRKLLARRDALLEECRASRGK